MADGTQRRILVVEDNERNRKLACAVLESAGMDVTAVGTGAAALDACRADRPDAALLDIQLPDCSGVDLLQDLRRDETTAMIPLIAVTAFAMGGDRERLLGEGFDGYIEKPIDVATFAATVAGFIDRSRFA